ncbi:MAG: AmmeMemoRadiSam system radical SAM enzyme [Oscillospiraceae bacterium]|nr:AmmeMemoRadiSam system radical SAM enzyme [Oscillospiraceae bacterium]
MSEERRVCEVCPHRCRLAEGQTGLCRARGMRDGAIVPLNYGVVTSIALDPIEKKPLARYYPGSRILSVGSFGCNLHCPFCQNWQISMSDGGPFRRDGSSCLPPERLAALAEELRPRGNIGVAFTYNEPLIGWEYVRDTAELLRERDLKVVLVTNGCCNREIAERLFPLVDALNIDLKAFRAETYGKLLGGDLETVKRSIALAAEQCHVELTTLIVPGMNDSEEEIRELTGWVASLPRGEEIPLHLSRFFPRYHMTDRGATPRESLLRLVSVAREKLRYVYPGNM